MIDTNQVKLDWFYCFVLEQFLSLKNDKAYHNTEASDGGEGVSYSGTRKLELPAMADEDERDHLQEEAEEVAHDEGSSQAGLYLHLLPTDQGHGLPKIIDDNNTRGGLIIMAIVLKLVLVGEAEHMLVTTGGDRIT